MSLYLQRHVGDAYHICPQMKVWKGHGLFAVSPPFFGAPISVSPKDSIGACRLRPEEILYGVGFNSRQLKDSWWPDFQICQHPLDHVKSTCSFSLFSPAFEPRCFVPLLKQGCPIHSTAKSDWRRFQQFPALMLLLLYISAA
jgi:hypothetical protein